MIIMIIQIMIIKANIIIIVIGLVRSPAAILAGARRRAPPFGGSPGMALDRPLLGARGSEDDQGAPASTVGLMLVYYVIVY